MSRPALVPAALMSLAMSCLALAACGLGVEGEAPPAPVIERSPAAPASPTADAPPAPPGDPAAVAPPAPKPATLRENRDRLLDTYAAHQSSARCPIWSSLSATQKGVFLTITDLLGHRSYVKAATPGTKGAFMALDHVTKVYAIRDKGTFGNGGGDNNRIWLQVDAELIAALRDTQTDAVLPAWGPSADWAGAHAPFDATSETLDGQPRGQAHFWSADAKSRPLGRPGVEAIDDPRAVEIDLDYDLLHSSNPEGWYIPGGNGRDKYASLWSGKGTGDSPELDYAPTGCP
jgi:hypothetical protein